MQPYAARVDKDFVPDYHGNIFDDIFEQYERVIIESLITSFGLDFIVKDQYGGRCRYDPQCEKDRGKIPA